MMASPKLDKPPVTERAGTHLTGKKIPVYGSAKKKRSQHGVISLSDRLYQTGGELRNFLFDKLKCISMDLAVWNTILDYWEDNKIDTMEFIDHDANRCYTIDIAVADQVRYEYEAGIGPRWGVHLKYFTITDSAGRVIKEGEKP